MPGVSSQCRVGLWALAEERLGGAPAAAPWCLPGWEAGHSVKPPGVEAFFHSCLETQPVESDRTVTGTVDRGTVRSAWRGCQHGQGRFLMGEAPAKDTASPCCGHPCSRSSLRQSLGRTYRGVFQGRQTPDC